MTEANQSGYAGQQGLTDDNTPFNQQNFLVWQILARVNTSIPVLVKGVHDGGVDAGPPTVDVLPLVRQIDGIGRTTPHGTIYGIPCLRLKAGLNAIVMDPEVGDIGFCIFAQRDISVVKETEAEANPGSRRMFDWADGVYVGGILGSDAPTQYIAFTNTGIKIADKNGNILEMTENGIEVTGNLVVSGDITSGSGGSAIGLRSHRHTQGNDSHGDTEVPTNAPTPGT